MGEFVYFIPGVAGLSETEAKRVGVLDLLPEGSWSTLETRRGPSEGVGVYVGRTGRTLGSAAGGEWVWQEGPEYWVGMDPEDPPKPRDLKREKMLMGHDLRLGDGEQWTIPVARLFPIGSPLPARLVLGSGGVWCAAPLDRFVQFSQDAERLFPMVFPGLADPDQPAVESGVPVEEAVEMSLRALRFNYRIDAAGASLLGLFEIGPTGNLLEILGAIVDVPGARKMGREAEKKKSRSPKP